MIPVQLKISGFLSYCDPVSIAFSSIDLACISGRNGSGKSALLDAITWCLFGQARKRDESLINTRSTTAEVSIVFEYEGNQYRVQRNLTRGKSTVLEFQVRRSKPSPAPDVSPTGSSQEEDWKPLTERTLRETQARIEQILRLDFDTFVNASFILQGKADQFTQQSAGRRKEVLGSILGLEIWESYRDRAVEKRKSLEGEVDGLDGRLAEIQAELAEEDQRKNRLLEMEGVLRQYSDARVAQESTLINIRKSAATLEQSRKLILSLAGTLERARATLSILEDRWNTRESERKMYTDLLQHEDQIEADYLDWQKAHADLEKWESFAMQFREKQQQRTPFLESISAERARLEEELRGLSLEKLEIQKGNESLAILSGEIVRSERNLLNIDQRILERKDYELQRNAYRERQAELKSENEQLKSDMEELKSRMDRLNVAIGAECPLCGQSLSEDHRKKTLKELAKQGKSKGDRFRANQADAKMLEAKLAEFESQIDALGGADQERLALSKLIAQLVERKEILHSLAIQWQDKKQKRHEELSEILKADKFALEVRRALANLDKALARLGYDPGAHEGARTLELQKRSANERHASLRTALAVAGQLDLELSSLNSEIKSQKQALSAQESEYQAACESLEKAESQTPDLQQSELELLELREKENQARDEYGAARQRVEILGTLRSRYRDYEHQRELILKQIVDYRILERAFGRDGVPALLIEQALPQIESKANELLDRLSDGQMSLRFITQAEYKDRKREDLRETLDIQISDPSGVRDYEMFSGGEAFRVNFAIRLALSEMLARRKGARLQTLVIDEGFGTQDMQGRQRLIEAINIVKDDFAKILVITHIDELKDAFPSRIEVEKTARGSTLQVS